MTYYCVKQYLKTWHVLFLLSDSREVKKKTKKKTIKWTAIVKFCFIRKPAIAGFNSIPEQINF